MTTLANVQPAAKAAEDVDPRPWYRQVTVAQWRAFWAVFLGWIVDSFDFNILTFILIDIQQSFTVDRALAGALGTVTLAMRLVGGTIAGTMADKWGRKLPLMLSLIWFAVFDAAIYFAPSFLAIVGAPVAKAVLLALALASADFALGACWAVCLDVGATHAGVVTGFMNTFGNLGGLVGPLVVSLMVEHWQSWTYPFYVTAAVYAMGALAWLAIDPHRRVA